MISSEIDRSSPFLWILENTSHLSPASSFFFFLTSQNARLPRATSHLMYGNMCQCVMLNIDFLYDIF